MFLKYFGNKTRQSENTGIHQIRDGNQVDPEMNYCPRCDDEYRPDIVDCAGCGVTLITGVEKLSQVTLEQELVASRSMEIAATDELVTLQKGSVKDIKVLQKLLARERIPGVIAGDEASCQKGCCGPELFLQIRKQEMDAASETLTKGFVKTTALETHDITDATAVFDHLAKETVCPACSCRFSPTVGACPECGLCFE